MSTRYHIWPETRPQNLDIRMVIYNNLGMITTKINPQTGLSAQICESELQSNYCPSVSDDQSNKKRDRWTPEQNIRYAQFLKNNIEFFQTTQLRKKNKVFSKLSKFMPKRSVSQAKSHHQKMILRHKEVYKIIQYIQNKLIKKVKKQIKRRKVNLANREVKQQRVSIQLASNAFDLQIKDIITFNMQNNEVISQGEWFQDV